MTQEAINYLWYIWSMSGLAAGLHASETVGESVGRSIIGLFAGPPMWLWVGAREMTTSARRIAEMRSEVEGP